MKTLDIYKSNYCKSCPNTTDIEKLNSLFKVRVIMVDTDEGASAANEVHVYRIPAFIVDGERRYSKLEELISNEIEKGVFDV